MKRSVKLSSSIMFLVSTPCRSFQTSSPLILTRVATTSRVPSKAIFPAPTQHDRTSYLWAMNSEDSTKKGLSVASTKPQNNIFRYIAKMKRLILCLAIFLQILFTSLPSWAVQSGGRIGGSVGGSSKGSNGNYSSSRSYSREYSKGYSSGYKSRPNVIVSPGVTPYYSPFYSPFSFGPSYARPGVIVSTGPSFGGIFFFVSFFLLAAFTMSSMTDSIGSMFNSVGSSSILGPGVSVVEISVALDVSNRDKSDAIMNVLDRLADTARTDSRVGLQMLTNQVALELLRRKHSIVAASTRANHFRDESKAKREFNNLSIQERAKFQRETVSKYGGIDFSKKRADSSILPHSDKATIAVVTILLQIDGDSTCNTLSSTINSIRDVEQALSRIAADSQVDDCLKSVEILWTPEERDETLTMRDVLADYSDLRAI